jgi:hypothetical protein
MSLLKEPLLHFLAIGGLLFATHAAVDRSGPPRMARDWVAVVRKNEDHATEL